MSRLWTVDTGAASGSPSIRVHAPAKLNLTLRVLGRRADGYHVLDSLVGFLDLHDTVSLTPAPQDQVRVTGPFAQGLETALSGDDDLALRALRAVRLAAERGRGSLGWVADGVEIRIEKRIPLGAGLGGGSADAAAVLRAMKTVLAPDGRPDLAALGLTLGADVPVCLSGGAQRMSGIGEDLNPLPSLPALGLVLCHPGRPVPTGDVFAAVKGRFSPPAPALPDGADADALIDWLVEHGRNDLAAPSAEVDPSGGDLERALSALPGARYVSMTGSGAVRFALFSDRGAADQALTTFRRAQPTLWSAAATLLP